MLLWTLYRRWVMHRCRFCEKVLRNFLLQPVYVWFEIGTQPSHRTLHRSFTTSYRHLFPRESPRQIQFGSSLHELYWCGYGGYPLAREEHFRVWVSQDGPRVWTHRRERRSAFVWEDCFNDWRLIVICNGVVGKEREGNGRGIKSNSVEAIGTA